MCRVCWLLLTIAFLASGGLAYKLLVVGNTAPSTDGRTTILMSGAERDLVLAEMRAFLLSVQQVTRGVAENDMGRVSEYARKVGRAAQADVPASLMAKLPLGFKNIGLNTHQAFDQLALDAEEFGDAEQVLTSLNELMNNCVACHATYRLDLEAQQ